MSEDTGEVEPLFLQLVLSLDSAAWYQLGKVASPLTGKIERDLAQAKMTIDLLVMLQKKTSGNLLGEEKRILDTTIYNLQMNYIDECSRDVPKASAGEEPGAPGQSDAAGEGISTDGSAGNS